jgi:hypothetical protein
MGSNPTRSIFISLVNYGIKLSSFLVIVGQTVGCGIGIAGNFVRQEVVIRKMIEASQRMIGKENNNNPAMHKYFELRIKTHCRLRQLFYNNSLPQFIKKEVEDMIIASRNLFLWSYVCFYFSPPFLPASLRDSLSSVLASPPSLATLSLVSSSAACRPLSSCGASLPSFATLSLVSSSAYAKPLFSLEMPSKRPTSYF